MLSLVGVTWLAGFQFEIKVVARVAKQNLTPHSS
jgi:hypothetical protein